MTIPEICKIHSQNLAHNLRLAKTDDEQMQYLSAALNALGEQVIPPMNQLFAKSGKECQELERARAAVLELTGVICGNFVRKCTDYSWGVAWFDKVSSVCQDPQIKIKLAFYTNQLKKRWNIAEPGGLAHNPRAKRVRTELSAKSPSATYLGIALFLGIVAYMFGQNDFTTQNQSAPISRPQAQSDLKQSVQAPLEKQPTQPVNVGGAYYTFTDKQGIVHMVNDLNKVPFEYRQAMKVDTSTTATVRTTPVTIVGDQVIVPVTITFRGRSASVRLLLDTGATVTTINEAVAAQLGLNPAEAKLVKTTVADGRSVDAYRIKTDAVAVAEHVMPNVDVSMLPNSGSKGCDGLLGMNYLKNFRYHVNFSKSVIEWGG